MSICGMDLEVTLKMTNALDFMDIEGTISEISKKSEVISLHPNMCDYNNKSMSSSDEERKVPI